ncbi:uncharacterized protein LOC131663339 [Phymastichus coffea]|uniref:uncharacterized protein LOC131663339 n=1 Tax=Phymastichus coffea TaxID=108790 RepID=UPI00273BF09D|nr:uncharacterized protein LOC131663339 [Phymastichus coffea]
MEPNERRRLVTDRGLCYNCLSSSHTARSCPSTSFCRNCSGSHHTLIYDGAVTLSGLDSRRESVRALLDPCSDDTLVCHAIARRLNCNLRRVNVGVTGVFGTVIDSARFQTLIRLIDPSTNCHWNLDALVLHTIGIITPTETPEVALTLIKDRLLLADPFFYEPRSIDIVLGADAYYVRNSYTLTGASDRNADRRSSNSHACTSAPTHPTPDTGYEQLLSLVQRFWETEKVPHAHRISIADRECEKSYTNGHSRDSTGRYVVPLPVKAESLGSLGDGLPQARAALTSLHRRMLRDPDLQIHYRMFMSEYLQLGHMRRKGDNERKLRVVFNASRPTVTGRSLNDALHAGPKLQSSISDVLSHWRRYRHTFCANVKMMFHQILVADHHVHLQRNLSSASADDPPEHYVLLTVMYGETCAPYLAICILKQLSVYDDNKYPDAADAIERELYVDDFLSGGHDIPSTKRRRHQLITLLKADGYALKKWVANEP